MSNWFYVDGNQARQGPVSTDALVEAYRQGQVANDSLVWREGLAQWSPLQAFRDELGLADVTPIAAPPAPAGHDAAPKKSRTGCWIAAVVLLVGGFFMLAILAAIALPAYQDYVTRSKLAAVRIEGQAAKVAVDKFMANTDRCPRDAEELGLPASTTPGLDSLAVGSLRDGRCAVELTVGALGSNRSAVGGTLLMTREEDGTWSCSGDGIPEKMLPGDCR